MLELHYPTVTKTILERQYPGKPLFATNKTGHAIPSGARWPGDCIGIMRQRISRDLSYLLQSSTRNSLTWEVFL